MKAKVKAKVAVKEKEITREIKGDLVFQRAGVGSASFKAISGDVLSNPIIQFGDILPADYAPEDYNIKGSFVYKIVAIKK